MNDLRKKHRKVIVEAYANYIEDVVKNNGKSNDEDPLIKLIDELSRGELTLIREMDDVGDKVGAKYRVNILDFL